jgi:mannitol-1-phosphate 5-dehydrogenase
MEKLVLFGAGKIGRSFIGQLFSRGGYDVVFVDIDKNLVEELNKKRCYKIVIKSEKDYALLVENVRAVHLSNHKTVFNEVYDASILAVSVGQRGLNILLPILAENLLNRFKQGNKNSIDIIIAENMRNASAYFSNELKKTLPPFYPFDSMIGLVESSIGKMVPIMVDKDMEDDPLQVFAEPYNTLIVDRKGFKNPIPEIEGIAAKDSFAAWVDRKLFIHNLGHAALAYFSFCNDSKIIYTWQALQVTEIYDFVRSTMMQSAIILKEVYPEEFTIQSLTEHIDDLLFRFSNKALGDTIYRVGCDVTRKLSPDDRIAGAIRLAIKNKKPYDLILKVLICACYFRATDENGKMMNEDIKFIRLFNNNGLNHVLKTICGFDEETYKEILNETGKIIENIGFKLNLNIRIS